MTKANIGTWWFQPYNIVTRVYISVVVWATNAPKIASIAFASFPLQIMKQF